MDEIIAEINRLNSLTLSVTEGPKCYAKIHAGIAHVHSFWGGNGRIARLLANIPLLNADLPPLFLPVEERRNYIQILSEYELAVGSINCKSGVWPNLNALEQCEVFVLRFMKTPKVFYLFRVRF